MPVLTLTITLDENNRVGVSGPIHNKVICFGMIECAKDAIRAHIDKLNAAKEKSELTTGAPLVIPQ